MGTIEEVLRTAGEKVLEAARRKGVEAEAYLLHDQVLNLEVANDQIETLKEAEETGLGLRVLRDGRLGFAYTSDLSDQALMQTVEDAISICSYAEKDEYNVLPRGGYSYPGMELFDREIQEASLETKIELARTIEREARSRDTRIKIVERAGFEDSDYTCLIMNSNGLYASARANICGIYVSLVAAEENDAQNGFAMMIKKHFRDLNPVEAATEASDRALRSLNARSIASAHMPCVMESNVFTRFMGLLAQMVDAEAVQKGKSLFAGRLGDSVASPLFSVVDDSTLEAGIGSFPFDGEGVLGQKTLVIEKGVLKSFLHDTYTASKDGIQSTGNGQRGSFRGLPSVGVSNFILSPGDINPQDIIGEVEQGLYVTDVIGMHTANPISGDFSVGATGIVIEKGRLAHPVRGITIAGNLGELFRDIDALGNDLRFFGARGAPTVRVKSLSVAGE